MNVLSVGYPLLPVGPDASGGAEQILSLLDRGLARLGHRSIVVAAKGSVVSGELIGSPAANGEMTPEVRSAAQRHHLRLIESVLDRRSIDLIHFHGLDFHAYVPNRAVRKLATLHLPPDWYPPKIFQNQDVQLVCVSQAQASRAPAASTLRVIPNGIDLGQFSPHSDARTHLLWLGRICPEKGVHLALEVAHRLNLPMIVAGPVHPFRDHQIYFNEKVRPLLDSQRQHVGAVGLFAKQQLLTEAICLLIPSLVEETSSLVAMEAIGSGTPVVAFRRGALPEVIESGVTGFLVDSQEEMANAVARAREISPEVCRERARARFDASRMVAEYLKLYESK